MAKSSGKKRRKRVITVNLMGAYTLLQHIHDAGHGDKLINQLSKSDQRVKMSIKTFEAIKNLSLTEHNLAENIIVKNIAASGCDPHTDPECIPWE